MCSTNFVVTFVLFNWVWAWLNSDACFRNQFTLPLSTPLSVAAVCVSGQNQQSFCPPQPNPIAIRNIRGNHFANAARPQLAFCCGVCGGGGGGVWRERGVSWLLLSLRVPYFILIYSVVHAYFRYGLPRRIHAFPSGWLGSFGSTIAWLQQHCPAPAHVTAHFP